MILSTSSTDGGGSTPAAIEPVVKRATRISGFDDISNGGLPAGRLTAIAGGPGAGKTMFCLQTLYNRLRDDGEPGLFVTFEESVARVRENIASFSWGAAAAADTRLTLFEARLGPDADHAGAFDMNGLLSTLSLVKRETGARNVVFDGVDALLAALPDSVRERQELTRIEQWIEREQVTGLLTTKLHELDERSRRRADCIGYLADCVTIFTADLSPAGLSRSVRIAKFRGSAFSGNPFPLVIGASGVEVVAKSAARLAHPTFSDRVSTGVARLDGLLFGGYLRGSCALISGAPGTAKTSLSAAFVDAACAAGRKAMFVGFDESASLVASNMRSIGLDLRRHLASGALTMASYRSSGQSPEELFVAIRDEIERHAPDCLAIDPLSALLKAGYPFAGLIDDYLLDYAKSRGVTTVCTSLLEQNAGERELSASHVSTIADTWLHLSYVALNGERNRALTIVKSRGTAHSSQVRELTLSGAGLDLVDVYAADGAVLMGSARAQKEEALRDLARREDEEFETRRHQVQRSIGDLQDLAQQTARRLEMARREADLLLRTETERRAQRERAQAARVDLRSRGDVRRETP